jgi:hypothetical protein
MNNPKLRTRKMGIFEFLIRKKLRINEANRTMIIANFLKLILNGYAFAPSLNIVKDKKMMVNAEEATAP